ncbi:restriction endonuclease subunit S [Elizabethkingia meningoseptica]|uniref:restriction endonuclease subunit S n=1 Tax=Elizabethkingia meningoseptica TaxID=238 RepID=UPI0023AEC85E|nr:restriction endonuclease subunit S [Elizabethkingia meningoseptica]MDE5437279.1 restriction endonuclease subunit S [Elizabethkingia meningoseptica]MDE5510381.1 restriction endonuclease subunit S [Elizabethkingia meningoseptica]MDE5514212.1 restriction endonuclease subunit S [Elizabethkingia meningoseptica]MDE5524859.1 restriction endonuclease subunit S [Elizabethkingia meningoseptica]MDE5528423.1 restriction endonuclease subunit S [Elizabethkingia meningoseptica]
MEWENNKLKSFLKQYRIEHKVQDNIIYKQVTISKHTGVSFRGEKIGKEIGRKRQFVIDLDKHPNTLLLVRQGVQDGSIGFAPKSVNKCIVTENMPMFSVENIDVDFLKEYINSPLFKDILNRLSPKGAAQKSIHEKELLELNIRIPKFLDDQKKIGNLIKENTLNSSQINQEITHQLDLIKDLRQAFLREAMQGKLVSNETSDGKKGADLLAEIQAEKAQLIKEKKFKKPKPLAPITQEEIPFEIPENWTWCRLGEFGNLKRGKSKHRPRNDRKLFDNGNTPFIQTGDVSKSKYNKDIIKTINGYYNDFGLQQSELQPKGTLCITIAANIAESGFLGFDACLPDSIVCFETKMSYSKKLVHFFIRFSKNKIEKFAPATAQKNINLGILNDLYFPLPPLEIQERIVTKLDELMAFCDQLEEQIKQSQQTNDLLLQQVLREALGEKKEEFTELQLVAEHTEQYIAKYVTAKTCDKNDMAVLTGYIIQELNTKDFGRVKLQKMLHLVEYHCQLETNFNYYKKVAGPHAEELKESIEPILQRNRFFDIKKEKLGNKEKVNYTALAGASQINKFFNSDFKEQKENIDFVLHKFRNKTWEFCEMISTMYAVWNNRLIKQQSITNDDLKKDFLEWDKEKMKFVDQLDYSIEWIKKENLEPKGLGKYIDRPQAK